MKKKLLIRNHKTGRFIKHPIIEKMKAMEDKYNLLMYRLQIQAIKELNQNV